MCFNVFKSTVGPVIAEEDIVVYKGMTRILFFLLESPYQETVYLPFITKRKVKLGFTESSFKNDSYIGEIEEGYHSCGTPFAAARHSDMVGKFIIPKGSTYYYNKETSDYVSDQIKLVNIRNQYKRK